MLFGIEGFPFLLSLLSLLNLNATGDFEKYLDLCVCLDSSI